MLTHHPMTEAEKHLISAWKYTGEYALYNTPPYEEDLKTRTGFAHPDFVGFTFFDGRNLIGFTCLYEEERAVMVGIGIAPEHCGKGYGPEMLRITQRISQQMYPQKPLYLEVRTWNTRAVRCYEKAGYVITGEPFKQTTGLGEGTFYRMVFSN